MIQPYNHHGNTKPSIVAIGSHEKTRALLLLRIIERIEGMIPEKLSSFCQEIPLNDSNHRYSLLILDIDSIGENPLDCVIFYRKKMPNIPLVLVFENFPLSKETIVGAYSEGVLAIINLKKELFSLESILKAALKGQRAENIGAIQSVIDYAIQKHCESQIKIKKEPIRQLTHLEKILIEKIKMGKSNKAIVIELKIEGFNISEDKLKREIIPTLYELFGIDTANTKKVEARQLLISKINSNS